MNIQSLVGKKINQTQGFLEDGTRVPLSIISMGQNVVSQVKTQDHEGYNAIQLGFGIAKRANKPLTGHLNKAGLKESKPRFFREVKVDDVSDAATGTVISVATIFEPGDIVDIVGTSKGKGYAGVVKRHGFHGGPKTHGQSDRHRAPGASGQGTTPGRVYKGKRMAGRMGNERVTIKNLEVLDIQGDTILVKGLVPGSKGSVVMVSKVGKNKKFMPLWSEKPAEETPVETAPETVKEASQTVETPEEKVETASDTVTTAEESIKTEAADTSTEVQAEQEAAPEVNEGEKEENAG